MKKYQLNSIIIVLLCSSFACSAADLRVNRDRIEARIMALAEFGKNPDGGVSRVAYSDADIAGRDYLVGLMVDAGLQVRTDTAGNIIGSRAGTSTDMRPILFGSHADSVPGGGNYDGDVGTIAAIEVAQVLHEANIATRHPIEVVIFANEEGALVGSKYFVGQLNADDFSRLSHSGYEIGEGIERIGGDPANIQSAVRGSGDYAAFVELHIEQGSVLYDEGIDIGVVEGIVGAGSWEVVVEGVANHAGTTPMHKRRDALVSAAELIVAINHILQSGDGDQVGTVGSINAEPGASNVVPGRVVMSLEIRDLDEPRIEIFFKKIEAAAAQISKKNKTNIVFNGSPLIINAVPTDMKIRDIIFNATRQLNLSSKLMPSGAGHDAQSIASIAPMGMIFVPSVDGISHSPGEFTSAKDMANGADTLLHTILAIDGTVSK
jgi:N-carbamoyl-L-amino-acid hydrolase